MLFAENGEGGAGGLLLPGLVILMIVGMYFLMIRPQNKRRKEMMEKQRSATPGQTIVTIGGLHATIIDADDTTVTLEVSPGVMCVYERGSIARTVDDEAAEDETVEAADDEASKAEAGEESVVEAAEEVAAEAVEDDDAADKDKTKSKGKSKPSYEKRYSDGTQN